MSLERRVDKVFTDLFPINRSLTGKGVEETFNYLIEHFLPDAEVKSIPSGTNVFDWKVPKEWNIKDAWVKNSKGQQNY